MKLAREARKLSCMTPQQQAQATTADIIAQCRDQPLVKEKVRPDLCPELARIILDRMMRLKHSNATLNVGGWKSPETLFQWPEPAIQELYAAIVGIVGDRNLKAWAMVNSRGSHHRRHQHGMARVVGVYYVTVGDENAPTPTIYECPTDLHIDPDPGRLVLAPGTMWHRVPECMGDIPRITISFDILR